MIYAAWHQIFGVDLIALQEYLRTLYFNINNIDEKYFLLLWPSWLAGYKIKWMKEQTDYSFSWHPIIFWISVSITVLLFPSSPLTLFLFSCGATLYTVLCVCLSVCLSDVSKIEDDFLQLYSRLPQNRK